MVILGPFCAALAIICLWMPCIVQCDKTLQRHPQALFIKRDAIETVGNSSVGSKLSASRRLRRQSGNRAGNTASADQMVQNILQWLQGVYTQNSRRIRQGTLREYLPPSNTQRPRPFQPNGGGIATTQPDVSKPGRESEDFNYIGYPPTGDTSPQPGFPLPPAKGNGGYPSPPPDITPPISIPDFNGGGYPKQPAPHPGFPTPAQTTPRPGINAGDYSNTGYPSHPLPSAGSTTDYPTTGYQPTTGYGTTKTYVPPPSTFRPGGFPTSTLPDRYPTGFPTATPPPFSTGFPTPGYSNGFPTAPPPSFPSTTAGATERPPHGGTTPSEQPETEGPEHRPPYTSEPIGSTTTAAPEGPDREPSEPATVEEPAPKHPEEDENTVSPPDEATQIGEGSEDQGKTTDIVKLKDQDGDVDENEDLKHPPHIHDITVDCAKDMMTINIEFNRIFDGIIYSKGFYSQPDCRYVTANSGKTKYTFTVSLNACGTEFINGFDRPEGQSYLENVLVLQNEPGIQEVWDTIRAVRCLWEGNLNKALSVALTVGMLNQEIVTFSGDTAMAMLDIQLGKGPFAPPANGLVKIGEVMSLVVSVTGDPGFDIQVKDCRAKDSAGDNEVQLTDDNGCVLKPKLFGAFQKTRNTGNTGASIIAYALFNAFKFPDVMDLMIECNVELCKTDCEVCPDPNQQLEPGRRRRRRKRDISISDGIPRNNNSSTLGEPVTIGKLMRVFVPEDVMGESVLATLDVLPQHVCFSAHTFLLASILLISLLCASGVLCAYLWFRDKNHRLFIAKTTY